MDQRHYKNLLKDSIKNNISHNENEDCYRNTLEHVEDELLLFDLMLYKAFFVFNRSTRINSKNEISGLVLTDEEIENILYESCSKAHNIASEKFHDKTDLLDGQMNLSQDTHEFADEYDNKINELNFLINKFQNLVSKKKTNSSNSHITLSSDLTKILEISDTEYAIFMGCLAIELDTKYEKIYAYLQDDITKKRPTLNLISRIIGLNFVNKIQNFYAIGETSILFRAHLIEFVDESIGLMSRPLKINDSLISFVFNPDNQVQIPAHLKDSIRLFPASEQEKPDKEIIEPDPSRLIQLDQLENLKLEILACLNNGLANKDRFAILLFGKNNSGRKTIIKSLVNKIEYYQHMLIFDIKKDFLHNSITAIESSCNFINLVSLLKDSFIYVDGLRSILKRTIQT